MQDISVFGLQLNLVASVTFPAGFLITQFADDADPFDIPSLQIADKAMGVNGDLITWSKANPLEVTINVVPGGEDDTNLNILLNANRVGRGKFSARDIITMAGVYPDGRTVTLTQGKLTNGSPARSGASSGRLKTKPYVFAFEGST